MTQGSMPLRDNALSYFQSRYSSEKLDELWEETKEYMGNEFPNTNWSQTVSELELRRRKQSDGRCFFKKTANSADDSAEPAA